MQRVTKKVKGHMLRKYDLLGEIVRKRYVCVPYNKTNRGLVLELRMEQRCDLESSRKKDGGERVFQSKSERNEKVKKRGETVFILG